MNDEPEKTTPASKSQTPATGGESKEIHIEAETPEEMFAALLALSAVAKRKPERKKFKKGALQIGESLDAPAVQRGHEAAKALVKKWSDEGKLAED